jgi:hypothetical protein
MVWNWLQCQPYRIPYQHHCDQASQDDHHSHATELDAHAPAAWQRSDAEFVRGALAWILGKRPILCFLPFVRILLDHGISCAGRLLLICQCTISDSAYILPHPGTKVNKSERREGRFAESEFTVLLAHLMTVVIARRDKCLWCQHPFCGMLNA